MGGSRKILLAVDESDHSIKAGQWISDNIVFKPGDKLYIVNVISPPNAPVFTLADPVFSSNLQGIMQTLKEKSFQNSEELVGRFEANLKSSCKNIETIAREGDVRVTMKEIVDEVKPDTMVIGSRGMGAVKKILLGSVSSYCAYNCDCAVVLVK